MKSDTTNIVRLSLVQNPDIAVFLPSKSNATGEAVVICPGGGQGIFKKTTMLMNRLHKE
jgi:hypothetical protein